MGVEGYYKQRGVVTNFAKGFVDMGPGYQDKRHRRAADLARKWEAIIGDKMKQDVEVEGRRNFNDHIQKGNKLSVQELKALKQDWKTDYIQTQLTESTEVSKYVNGI